MDPYIRLFVISIVACQIYSSSYERHIQSAKGQRGIDCGTDSIFVTNATRYSRCNGKQNCPSDLPFGDVSYVCLKKTLRMRHCRTLEHAMKVNQTGCYYNSDNTEFGYGFECSVSTGSSCHIFVLHGYLHTGSMQKIPTFGYFNLRPGDGISTYAQSWILVKVSHDTEEADFSEFFTDGITTTSHKTTVSTEHITAASPASQTSTSNNPKSDSKPADKTVIIVGAIIIILLFISVLVAVFCFRRKFRKDKRDHSLKLTKTSIEPAVPIRREDIVGPLSTQTDEALYDTANPDYQDPSQQYLYAEIGNKKGATRGDPSRVDVNGDLYATVQKEGKATPKSPEILYAELELHRDTNTESVPGGLTHVDVNGDLYATVQKEEDGVGKEESYYANARKPDVVIGEEPTVYAELSYVCI